MDIKKILSLVALLLGEVLIIVAFILFRGNMPDNILVLNIVVTNIIYGLFFLDILVPWIDLDDKSQRKVGSLGIRWLAAGLYNTMAIGVMILANVAYEWTFSLQIIIHGVLFFMLLLGFVAAFHASDKVNEIYEQESAHRDGINGMKSAMQSLKDRMSGIPGLPEYFINRINTLEENIRFVSPANNQEARELESTFIKITSDIAFAVSNFSMNEEAIINNIKKLEIILQNRRQVYSY